MSFKEFSQLEIEQLFQELITDMREEQLQALTDQFGSIEAYRQVYMNHAGESKAQQNFKKMIEWYGKPGENNQLLNSYQRRIDELFKRIAEHERLGGDELSAKRMIGEYEFVCRQLYQAVDVKALLCKQAELFVKDKEMLSVLDQRYGKGSALAISHAIMNFYN